MSVNQAVTGVNIMNAMKIYRGKCDVRIILGASMTNSRVAPPLSWPEPSTRGLASSNNLDKGCARV